MITFVHDLHVSAPRGYWPKHERIGSLDGRCKGERGPSFRGTITLRSLDHPGIRRCHGNAAAWALQD